MKRYKRSYSNSVLPTAAELKERHTLEIKSTGITGTSGSGYAGHSQRTAELKLSRTAHEMEVVYMMNMPFVNTAATGANINRLRIQAGMTVKDMQMIFGFTTPQAI